MQVGIVVGTVGLTWSGAVVQPRPALSTLWRGRPWIHRNPPPTGPAAGIWPSPAGPGRQKSPRRWSGAGSSPSGILDPDSSSWPGDAAGSRSSAPDTGLSDGQEDARPSPGRLTIPPTGHVLAAGVAVVTGSLPRELMTWSPRCPKRSPAARLDSCPGWTETCRPRSGPVTGGTRIPRHCGSCPLCARTGPVSTPT